VLDEPPAVPEAAFAIEAKAALFPQELERGRVH
jgi:hypothetical protein